MRAQVTLDTLESNHQSSSLSCPGDYRIPRSGKRDTGSGISIGYINHFHPPNLELVMTVVDQVVAALSIPKKTMRESTF